MSVCDSEGNIFTLEYALRSSEGFDLKPLAPCLGAMARLECGGIVSVFDVSIYEPIGVQVTVDSLSPTVDSSSPTADGGVLEGARDFGDAVVNANFVYAEVVEPIAAIVTADSTAYTADNATWPTADGGLLEGARDALDAIAIPAVAVGGGYWPRYKPAAVIGYGYGVLPQLWGEAHGVVYIAGAGAATLPITGEAHGVVDDDTETLLMLMLLAA
jgi:hypothetical protein